MYGFIDRLLSEAAARGEFDDLPNAGQPLDLSENPFVPEDWRLAFKILRDNQIVPEFVARRKEIEAIRSEMKKLCANPRHDLRSAVRAELEKLARAVDALNRSLAREQQFVRGSLQLAPVDVEAELRVFDARCVSLPDS